MMPTGNQARQRSRSRWKTEMAPPSSQKRDSALNVNSQVGDMNLKYRHFVDILFTSDQKGKEIFYQ